MARLVNLANQIDSIKEQHFIRSRTAVKNKYEENATAIKIQSWIRACKVRAYIRHLHKNATIIQKTWRGFIARQHFRQRVKIQKIWRGYYTRKYVHNYYAQKRYMEALTKNNKQVRRDLEELAEHQRKERERLAMEKGEQDKYIQAQRLHFLLSTKKRPGVFNSPFHPEPDEMELRLRRVKLDQTRSVPREGPAEGPSSFLANKERLPPIHKTPKGPFRPAIEVQRQRYRPLEPSVHVATSITALEEAREELRRKEWKTRLINHPFLPFSKAHQNRKNEALLNITPQSPYCQIEYGAKYFREENKKQLQEKQRFKTVFTTCNVFDKFGQLYSNAGKIV